MKYEICIFCLNLFILIKNRAGAIGYEINSFKIDMNVRDFTILRNLIHAKWQFEGNVSDNMPEIIFIQNE